MSFLRGLQCTTCGHLHSPESYLAVCSRCGGILHGQYDLESLRERISRESLAGRKGGLWKYREILPILGPDGYVSLGEGGTFLQRGSRLAEYLGLKNLYLKDETRNPTGSFLDRGISVEITKARQLGRTGVSCGSTGNLAASLVAYAARAGMASRVFIAQRGNVDVGKFHQILAYGADVEIVANREKAMERAAGVTHDYHNISPYTPFFLEGVKTTGIEVVEQLEWEPPDWIVLPMGNGGHLSMTWRGLKELEALGLIEKGTTRIVGVQATGCAPIVDAFKAGSRKIKPVHVDSTVALDIGVENPSCGSLALDALRQSDGEAVAVSDDDILEGVRQLASREGIFAEPAAATTVPAVQRLVDDGVIQSNESVVCMITGMGLKYPDISRALVKGRGRLEHLLSRIEGRGYTTEIGQTKQYILKILSEGESYGYAIWKTLGERFAVKIKVPSVYQHLSELRGSGLIVETDSRLSPERRRRIYYDLSDRGRWTLDQLEKMAHE
ncbi:threonine synthase [Candidatus Thorarchaeota archaeon]|nr:MAG: threonine synthase [Candidatus Thorarchaeota archaeon]